MTLRVGQRAPEFERTTHQGDTISLALLRGQNKTVVLYFYPKDDTAGCTVEACSFRDAFEDFTKAGAVVIGVSGDSLEAHRKFAEHRRLPFLLISDEDGALRRAYDVPNTMLGLVPGRVTYVIDREGTIRHAFNSQVQVKRHAKEALAVIERLAKEA